MSLPIRNRYATVFAAALTVLSLLCLVAPVTAAKPEKADKKKKNQSPPRDFQAAGNLDEKLNKAMADLKAAQAEFQKASKEMEARLKDSQQKLHAYQRELAALNPGPGNGLIPLATYQKNVSALESQMTNLLAELKKALLEKEELNKAKIIAEIEANALRIRLHALEQAPQRLGKIMREANPGQLVPKHKENVEGLISNTDGDRFATITIGSDVGIAKGQMLHVFRLDPRQPKSLGSIRILDVRPHESVGELDKRIPPGSVRRGDRVGTSIINGSLVEEKKVDKPKEKKVEEQKPKKSEEPKVK